jgi:hypothetical protein
MMSTSMDFAEDLRVTAMRASTALRAFTPEHAARELRPGKWSPVEIIGHLVDSASNNHQRFVRARFRTDLRFEGYDQDAWVSAQAYRGASWPRLLDLWESFNLHLAHVMETTPDDVLQVRRSDHNLHQLAWEVVPEGEPVTLEYFMRDYVGHLKHHLRQIDPNLAAPPVRQRGKQSR